MEKIHDRWVEKYEYTIYNIMILTKTPTPGMWKATYFRLRTKKKS